ncbi:hypothetical protein SAMN05216556_10429 [Aequorivita viscosa]|nr:hypothetical protein SAMN05216556_10429 [Aequorivita viscosa]
MDCDNFEIIFYTLNNNSFYDIMLVACFSAVNGFVKI